MATVGQAPPAEFALYRRIGVRRAGVVCAKGAAYGWPRIAALSRRSGVRVGYLCHGVTARADDAAAWRREADVLRDAIRAAASLGAPLVYATSGGSGALPWEEAAERVAARLGPLAAEARALGVRLALENTLSVRSDLSFTHTVRDTARLAAAADAGLCVDLYCCWQEAGLRDTLAAHLDRVRLVQVSDFRTGTLTQPGRWVPGDGDIPLERLLGTVLELGYRGPVDVELLGPAIEAEGAEPALRRGLAWAARQVAIDRRGRRA